MVTLPRAENEELTSRLSYDDLVSNISPVLMPHGNVGGPPWVSPAGRVRRLDVRFLISANRERTGRKPPIADARPLRLRPPICVGLGGCVPSQPTIPAIAAQTTRASLRYASFKALQGEGHVLDRSQHPVWCDGRHNANHGDVRRNTWCMERSLRSHSSFISTLQSF